MKRLIQFELGKILMKRLTLAALVVVLGMSVLFGFSTYQSMYAYDGKSAEGTGKIAVEIDKSIAEKYKGILTDQKVQQMMTDFKPTTDLHGLNAGYFYQNAMQSAAFARFADINGNWNGLSVLDVFGNEEIKIGYVNGWLNTSKNMAKIFFFLSLVIVVMIAPVFSGEYSGVDNIILTSKYGKTKCTTAKVVSSLMVSMLATAFFAAINIIMAMVLYGNEGLDCSVLFGLMDFTEEYIPFNVTCATLLKYQVLLAFTSAISVTGITLILSAVCKNQMAAVVASAAIHLLSMMLSVSENSSLFRLIVLLPLYHSQFISIMAVEQMSNGILYAIWAVPVAAALMVIGTIISRRRFAKHQVI